MGLSDCEFEFHNINFTADSLELDNSHLDLVRFLRNFLYHEEIEGKQYLRKSSVN